MSPRSAFVPRLSARLRDSLDGWMLILVDLKDSKNWVRFAPPAGKDGSRRKPRASARKR
jgi:hypothetical protein